MLYLSNAGTEAVRRPERHPPPRATTDPQLAYLEWSRSAGARQPTTCRAGLMANPAIGHEPVRHGTVLEIDEYRSQQLAGTLAHLRNGAPLPLGRDDARAAH